MTKEEHLSQYTEWNVSEMSCRYGPDRMVSRYEIFAWAVECMGLRRMVGNSEAVRYTNIE